MAACSFQFVLQPMMNRLRVGVPQLRRAYLGYFLMKEPEEISRTMSRCVSDLISISGTILLPPYSIDGESAMADKIEDLPQKKLTVSLTKRQDNGYQSALADFANNFNGSAMRFNNSFTDAETKAGASRHAVAKPRFVSPVKALEHMG